MKNIFIIITLFFSIALNAQRKVFFVKDFIGWDPERVWDYLIENNEIDSIHLTDYGSYHFVSKLIVKDQKTSGLIEKWMPFDIIIGVDEGKVSQTNFLVPTQFFDQIILLINPHLKSANIKVLINRDEFEIFKHEDRMLLSSIQGDIVSFSYGGKDFIDSFLDIHFAY